MTTWANRHQKGKTILDLMKTEMMGWHGHQLDHMQIICTSLQTDDHASSSSLNSNQQRLRFRHLTDQHMAR